MDNLQGNISTIGVILWTILCPYISHYITQEVFLAIFGFILVIWSAYNPNTFKMFGNAVKQVTSPGGEPVLNDDFSTGDDDA